MSLLAAYLLRERPSITRHEWWVNTDVPDDVAFVERLCSRHPDFFSAVYSSQAFGAGHVERVRRINPFYRRCCAPRTVYIKLDDDICYIAPGALKRLVEFHVRNPEYFLVHANTVNSPLLSHVHQRLGAISLEPGVCRYDPYGAGLLDPNFARAVHERFVHDVHHGRTERWHFTRWNLYENERCSINCVSWTGLDFAQFDGIVPDDDEVFLSCDKPRALGRINAVCGEALVAHFAFFPQRPVLEQTDLLSRYAAIAPPLP